MQGFSKPATERLIKLANLLEQLEAENKSLSADKPNKENVTSSIIEYRTGWSRDTIRRDISLLGLQCGSSNGYNIRLLKDAINEKLKISSKEKKSCIVGLGSLGAALIYYEGFNSSSFVMKAGFDFSVNRTEVLKSPFPLYPMSALERVIKEEGIEYAILTVPEKDARKTALRLASSGIKGIVNFTTTVLNLKNDVKVENISIIDALQKVSVEV